MSSEPRSKKMRQMIIGENMQNEMPRYKEFGEKPRWEIFDWEGKMKAYEKDLIEKTRIENLRKEKAAKLEKGWELMRLCKSYIETHSKNWKNEEDLRKTKIAEEEKKMERLREVARKKRNENDRLL